MKYTILAAGVILLVHLRLSRSNLCGCKIVRPCYEEMVQLLRQHDEVECVEDASFGITTISVFLKALKRFCPEVIDVFWDAQTIHKRNIYEVVIEAKTGKENDKKPVFLIDSGQGAGSRTVGFALYLIEQLVACQEQEEMIQKFKWVILPCVNPDGMVYARFNSIEWTKNTRPLEKGLTFGVDITRNFDSDWKSCGSSQKNIFSPSYPGPAAFSENETLFVKNMIDKYKNDAKVYVSLRRDGHSIRFPYAYSEETVPNAKVIELAGDVAAKVNHRAGGVQLFLNDSIRTLNGQARCGHSVDYAYSQGICFSYEMKVFISKDNRIISKFHMFPKGYAESLRLGYFSGFKEIFNYFNRELRKKKMKEKS